MAKLDLPEVKFVVEPHSAGATLAMARLIGEHYEISRTASDMTQVSKMMGRALEHLFHKSEKRKQEVDALYRMVLPLLKKGGKKDAG